MMKQAPLAQSQEVPAVSVFVRVRPLIASESGSTVLPGLALDSTDASKASVAAFVSGKAVVGGFAGVLGQEANNSEVFQRCVAARLPTVLRGGTASLFCYGYTGGGKTHTVIGYGAERGLYFLAAQQLLSEVRVAPDATAGDGAESLFLHATACEIYNDAVFDLLGTEKLECKLYTDEGGQLQVLRRTETEKIDAAADTQVLLEQLTEEQRHEMTMARDRYDETGMPSRFDGTIHSTDMVKSEGLRSISIFCPEDMEEISRSYVQQRAVGTSTQHETSSRSHAILRVEVVNASVLEARQSLNQARGRLPAHKNALDNVSNVACKLLFDGRQPMLLRGARTADEYQLEAMDENIWSPVDHDGWFVSGNEMIDSTMKFRLKGTDGELRTIQGWAEQLGVPELHYQTVFAKKCFDQPGLWESKHAALCAQKQAIEEAMKGVQTDIERASATLAEVMSRGPAALGGSLVMVDLAGADYDHRAGAPQKESAAINKSLFALKECLRALAGVSTRPKFRDSKLTRLMEDALAPTAASSRRCRESVSIMLVNVSPVERLEKMTMNSLRYGQLYAEGATGSVPKRPVNKAAPTKLLTALEVKQ